MTEKQFRLPPAASTTEEVRQVGAAVLRGVSTGAYAAAWSLLVLAVLVPLVETVVDGDAGVSPWWLVVLSVPLFSAGWWLRSDADKVARGDRLEA